MSGTAFIDPQFLKGSPMEHEGASLSSQMVNAENLFKHHRRWKFNFLDIEADVIKLYKP